jgi:plastocyanin
VKKLILLSAAALLAVAAVAVPALAATRSVKVGDDYFVSKGSKPTVSVKAGTTVKWVWAGKAPHDVVVTSGPQKFRSGNAQVKGSYSKKVTKKGTYKIVCTIHQPSMAMTLKVT